MPMNESRMPIDEAEELRNMLNIQKEIMLATTGTLKSNGDGEFGQPEAKPAKARKIEIRIFNESREELEVEQTIQAKTDEDAETELMDGPGDLLFMKIFYGYPGLEYAVKRKKNQEMIFTYQGKVEDLDRPVTYYVNPKFYMY